MTTDQVTAAIEEIDNFLRQPTFLAKKMQKIAPASDQDLDLNDTMSSSLSNLSVSDNRGVTSKLKELSYAF
jgi:hypothetical protein